MGTVTSSISEDFTKEDVKSAVQAGHVRIAEALVATEGLGISEAADYVDGFITATVFVLGRDRVNDIFDATSEIK